MQSNLVLQIFQFIKRLIIHIPYDQFRMIRYYGLYAKKYIRSSKLYL
ncbi:transposase [Tissierella carlieri]|nr:transposase [Tissierella carlieri]